MARMETEDPIRYRAIEPQEHSWHLPDRRTIRVVATPIQMGT